MGEDSTVRPAEAGPGISGDGELDADRAALEEACLARLEALDITFEIHHHPPVYTVDEAKALRGTLAGAHIKNLFICDRRKRDFWLLTVLEDRRVDLRALSVRLEAQRLRFANEGHLDEILGVARGAVTPLAVMNDTAARATFLLDADIVDHTLVNAHPLHNAATVTLSTVDLVRFAKACGHEPTLLTFKSFPTK